MSAATAYGLHDEERLALAEVAEALFQRRPDDATAGADEGFFGIGIPQGDGGAGGSFADLAVVIEAAGAATAATSLPWATGVIATLLSRHGAPAVLADVAAGRLGVAVPIGLAAADVTDGRLTAEMTVVGPTDGLVAVPVRRARDECLALIPVGAATITALPSIDRSRPIARIALDDVVLDGLDLITGPQLHADWQALACTVAALDAVGAGREALDRTLAYSIARHQFGRPIGSFQAYKHRLAHCLIELKLAQSLAFRAAAEWDTDLAQAYSAGMFATKAAVQVCSEAVQLHGGIGYTSESGIPALLKRARLDQLIAQDGSRTARRMLTATRLMTATV